LIIKNDRIEGIQHNGNELALIIRKNFSMPRIEFFTLGSFSQQLGYINSSFIDMGIIMIAIIDRSLVLIKRGMSCDL